MRANMTAKSVSIALFAAILTTGCGNQDFDFSKTCIEGRIPDHQAYRIFFPDCYNNTLWIEVITDSALGEDVHIIRPVFGFPPPEPLKYSNVIEVPLPAAFTNSTLADTLLGKKVFFQYRKPEESEISAFRNSKCSEVYAINRVPFLILTHFSFTQCRPKSD